MRTILVLLTLGLHLVAAPTDKTLELTFGVYTSDKATTMYRKFVPVLEPMQEHLERTLGRSVDISLKLYKTYDGCIDALVSGEIHFARFGPASYITASRRNKGIRVLAIEEKKGKIHFDGLVIVSADSPAKKLSDLAGKRFAFGDPNSTIGRYLAQSELLAAGVRGKDLKRFEYLNRHDRVAKAVEVGDFDAGALKEGTYKKMKNKDKVRVLHRFKNVTKPWLGSSKLSTDVAAGLRAALLELKDPVALKTMKVTGFRKAPSGHFDPIRKAMEAATKFVQ